MNREFHSGEKNYQGFVKMTSVIKPSQDDVSDKI
jgi:hypothetical protein